MGKEKRGCVVVITEYLPRFRDTTVRREISAHYGNNVIGTEIISVANLKHLIKTDHIVEKIISHITAIEKRDGIRGVFVIAEGGSHRTVVRTLRGKGIPSKKLSGITLHAYSLPSTIVVASSDRTLYGKQGVDHGVAAAYDILDDAAILSIPGGLTTLEHDSVWRKFLINELRSLTSYKQRRVVFVSRAASKKYTKNHNGHTDILQYFSDKLPGIRVDLAESRRMRDHRVVVQPISSFPAML